MEKRVSYPLPVLHCVADDLEPMDSRIALPHLMAYMKNTFIRAFNTLHHVAPLLTPSHPAFLPFLEYAQGIVDILNVHIEGDGIFFDTPDSQGRSLESALGSGCSPFMEQLEADLKEFRKTLHKWTRCPEHYSAETLIRFLDAGPLMAERMEGQVRSIDSERLSASFSNEEVRAKVQENINWFATRCDLSFLLPFIISHHDPATSVYWPAMTSEGSAGLPGLLEAHSGCWQFAPFDPSSREPQVWSPA